TVGNRKKPMLSRNSWDTVSSVVNCGSSHDPMSHMAACSVRNSALASALERALKPRLKASIRTSRCTSAAAWIRPGCVNGMRPLMASLTTSGPAMRSARYMYQSDPVQRSAGEELLVVEDGRDVELQRQAVRDAVDGEGLQRAADELIPQAVLREQIIQRRKLAGLHEGRHVAGRPREAYVGQLVGRGQHGDFVLVLLVGKGLDFDEYVRMLRCELRDDFADDQVVLPGFARRPQVHERHRVH